MGSRPDSSAQAPGLTGLTMGNGWEIRWHKATGAGEGRGPAYPCSLTFPHVLLTLAHVHVDELWSFHTEQQNGRVRPIRHLYRCPLFPFPTSLLRLPTSHMSSEALPT